MPSRAYIFTLLHVFMSSCLCLSLHGQDNCAGTLNKKDAAIYEDGISYLKRGNYVMTIQSMKQVLNGNPDHVDALYVMGLSWYKQADPNLKEAEKYFSRTINLCPGYDIYAYYYLGEIAYSFERFEEAVAYLSKFLEDVDKIKNDADYERAVQLL